VQAGKDSALDPPGRQPGLAQGPVALRPQLSWWYRARVALASPPLAVGAIKQKSLSLSA